MGRYEEMARKAIEEKEQEKAARDEEAENRRKRDEERRATDSEVLRQHIAPAVADAIKDFSKARVEARLTHITAMPQPYIGLAVGHNKVGRTGDRIATLAASADGGQLTIVVTSGNGPERRWKTDAAGAAKAIDEAIEDSLNRWVERGYPRRR
jgi:hypothetical protein